MMKAKMNRKHVNGDEFAHVRGKPITINKPEAIEQFEMNLSIFINICRAQKNYPGINDHAEPNKR